MKSIIFVATANGLFSARQDDHKWQVLEENLAAQKITAISVRDGKILAGTTAGVYHSDDLGQTWRPANKGLTLQHIRWLTHHPTMGGVAFAGTEPAAIFVTHDEAQTWQACPEVAQLRDENGWYLPYSPEAGCVRGFAFHGDRGYAAVEQGGLLRTDDAGTSWQPVEGCNPNPESERPANFIHPDVHSVLVHPTSPDIVLAPTGGGLYLSRDGGRIWKHLYDCYCRTAWIDAQDSNHMIFGPANSVDTKGRIERTLDGGKTWAATAIGVKVPWPKHMVERFVQVGPELIAVLSNGQVLAASLSTLAWRRILPQIETATAVAAEIL